MKHEVKKAEPIPQFQNFLCEMIREAFPGALDRQKEKVVPFRCPKEFLLHYEKLEAEAYSQGILQRDSFFYAIDSAMHREYDHFLHLTSSVTAQNTTVGNGEETPQTICWNSYIQRLPRCFPIKFPVKAPATLDQFYSEKNLFCDEQAKKWSNWLSNHVVPHPHVRFRLMRTLIYAILSPRKNDGQPETADCKNRRITEFLKRLLLNYMQCTLPKAEHLDDELVFSWYYNEQSTPVLSNELSAFISIVLFLSCLFSYKGFSDKEASFITKEFATTLRKRISFVNVNSLAFAQTQTEVIFYANPFFRDSKEFSVPPTLSHYEPPQDIPWDARDLTKNRLLRVHITAPAARGKTQLYRAVGKVLTSDPAVPNDQNEIEQLANRLHLPCHQAFLVVALNAQQFKWYCQTHGERECSDFIDMFFRGTLEHNGESKDTVDTVMNTIVPQKVQNAHKNHRLLFVFDGCDEFLHTPLQKRFLHAFQKFIRCYPTAHILLLSRPLSHDMRSVFASAQIKEYPLCPSVYSPCCSNRYQDALRAPLIRKLRDSNQFHSLAEIVTQNTFQIIDRVYDFPTRNLAPQLYDSTRSNRSIIEELAWEQALQPGASILHQLCKLLFGTRQAESDAVHLFAVQSGMLTWDTSLQDYRFSSVQSQAVLAASHIRNSIRWHANASMFRNELTELSDSIKLEITFALIHMIHEQDPLFAEMLLLDFAFYQWSDPYKDRANQDIAHMMLGDYGNTPFQSSNNTTMQKIFSFLVAT